MKKYFILMLLNSLFMQLYAQKRDASKHEADIKAINIGDRCPDLEFEIINYSKPKVKLSDFKGKLIILDYWSTGCGPCIRNMPKMDSLQKLFKDKIVILPISPEPKSEILNFWKKNWLTSRTHLSTIVNDNTAYQYFKPPASGTKVWIDPQGIFRALTKSEYVTAENIHLMLKEEKIDWPMDRLVAFDLTKPLINNVIQSTRNIPFSMISGNIQGVDLKDNIQIDSVNGIKRLYKINFPILGLYRGVALSLGLPINSIVLETADPHKLSWTKGIGFQETWNRDNTYCYEAVFPITASTQEINMYLLKDYNKFFKLNGRKENRLTSCWVLTRTSNNDSLLQSADLKKSAKTDEFGNYIKAEYTSEFSNMKKLILELDGLARNEEHNPKPVVDETNYTGKTRILLTGIIEKKPLTIRSAAEQLKKYGLELKLEQRKLDVFVITDDKN